MAYETLEDRIGKRAEGIAGISQQVLFLLGASQVVRFHNKPTIKDNTDAHHSWGVAMFAYLLSDSPSLNLIMAALSHDGGEQVWSDVSYPAKVALDIQHLLQEKEDTTLDENGFFFELTPAEERTLKLADALDGMLYCVSERRLGNKNLDSAFEKWTFVIVKSLISLRETEVFNAVTELWGESCRP